MTERNLPVASIADVCSRQLCTGCGVCATAEPERFRMGDAYEFGRRPFLVDNASQETGEALEVCPGVALEHTFNRNDPTLIKELTDGWGPVKEVWEGFAGDQAIRLAGSSGGAATALALYCIEVEGMSGVLHTGAKKERPYLNETVYSTSKNELLSNTGSRYAPSSPCDSLDKIEQAEHQSVFIGKPCDVAAVHKLRLRRASLEKKIGLTIGFFCAGTPSTRGTLDLLTKLGIDKPDSVKNIRYRGNGWPGLFTVTWTDEKNEDQQSQLTYEESWGFLQKYRQWRCYICPDHTGEFADIAVGDPWYRKVQPSEPGKSLILVRTEQGRRILHLAVTAGYIKLEANDPDLLPRSQPNLLRFRGSLWSRLIVLQFFGAASPRFTGFKTYCFWRSSFSAKEKIWSFTSTVKRVFKKRLRTRMEIVEADSEPVES